MNRQIKNVEVQKEYKLLHIDRSSFFRQLKDEEYFRTVRVSLASIEWKNGQDLSPDTLYLKSEPIFRNII